MNKDFILRVKFCFGIFFYIKCAHDVPCGGVILLHMDFFHGRIFL
jgi:hypothetical protein